MSAEDLRTCSIENPCPGIKEALLNPASVWTNMLRGTIAMPSCLIERRQIEQLIGALQRYQGAVDALYASITSNSDNYVGGLERFYLDAAWEAARDVLNDASALPHSRKATENQERNTMIEGIKVQLPGEELRSLLLENATAKRKRADQYEAELQAANERAEAAEYVVANADMRPAAEYRERARFFEFIAEHLFTNEIYQLNEHDLYTIGVGSKYD